MSVVGQQQPERRQQTYQLIAKLQNERHEVWRLYCEIAKLKPFKLNSELKNSIAQFSQMLIDYISLGHFSVYEHLLAGTERRDGVLSVANQIYPELSQTTDVAISFNDKYESSEQMSIVDDLEIDLSILGENLAKRIELEDQFCSLMVR